jgi:hypothetical protein
MQLPFESAATRAANLGMPDASWLSQIVVRHTQTGWRCVSSRDERKPRLFRWTGMGLATICDSHEEPAPSLSTCEVVASTIYARFGVGIKRH